MSEYLPLGQQVEAMRQVQVEGRNGGRPHEGKVLACVQAHADDIPFFCAGTVAKLVDEGYTAYLIQTTNDEKCGPTPSIGETVLINEQEVDKLAEVLGFKQVFNLGYRNHRLDEASPLELRARLVYLFRALKVDTVLSFNPWEHWEENPDHYVTGRAVEAASWMAGMAKDYPEQVACGLKPHGVKDKYYWVMRPHAPYNRVVDIGDYVDAKIEAMVTNTAQGPAGANGSRLRARLAAQGLKLPLLGDDDASADREYVRLFLLRDYAEIGRQYGLDYGEWFYYMPQGGTFVGSLFRGEVEQYIKENAVALD
jgi:LmbE family N-acetylglucosaminyl deacetylase